MSPIPLKSIFLSERFTLSLSERTLYRGSEPVKVGARALEILLVLAERPGDLIPKNELLERVWPGQHVDETALRVHLSALRRLLASEGEERKLIVNESGRGYRLLPQGAEEDKPLPQPLALKSTLPVMVDPILGREALIEACEDILSERRLLTLCGPGGVGKSASALALASAFSAARQWPVLYLDLADTEDFSAIVLQLAAQLGLEAGRCPAQVLGCQPLLILLDNCEHAIEAAAAFTEKFLRAVPNLVFLATSREALRVAGEWVFHVPPLALPDGDERRSLAEACEASAVRLFVERARSVRHDFQLQERDMPHLLHICQQLDGVPLALEMAAHKTSTYNLQELDHMLAESLTVLTNARRTVPARHRSLMATLEWSAERLNERERIAFQWLCLISGDFTMDEAFNLLRQSGVTEGDTAEIIAGLMGKSLLMAEHAGQETRYRFMRTIRRYGLHLLRQSPAWEEACRGHARHMLSLARQHSISKPRAEGLQRLLPLIDDMRIALGWASGPGGDAQIAESLAEISSRLFGKFPMPLQCLDLPSRSASCADSARILLKGGQGGEARRVLERQGSKPRPRGDLRALFDARLVLADLG